MKRLQDMGNSAMKTLAKWSVNDYHRMVEAGILQGRHVELLAGEIVEMSPETPLHYSTWVGRQGVANHSPTNRRLAVFQVEKWQAE